MGSRIQNIFFSNHFLLCLNNFQSIQELDWKGCGGVEGGGGSWAPTTPSLTLYLAVKNISTADLVVSVDILLVCCCTGTCSSLHESCLCRPRKVHEFPCVNKYPCTLHICTGTCNLWENMGCLMMHVNIIMRKIEETGCNELMSALCLDKSNLMLWLHKLQHFNTLLYIKFCKNEIKNVCQTTFLFCTCINSILYLY